MSDPALSTRFVRSLPPRAALVLAMLTIGLRPVSAGDHQAGAAIFREKCAWCHGDSGQGTEDYPRALTGDRSVAQLSKLIAKTMPEDDPASCEGEDADRVADYIHDAFYSSLARERNRPARIEVSRLTVRQHRNALADLIGGFRSEGHWGDQRGLKAEYYKSRRFRDGDRAIERIDPEVRFDFGLDAPDPSLDPSQFSIRWEGSVLAPETGDYEFIVRTDHAMRFWVNDPRAPLIDATVKSGADTEYRATIPLLAGRPYYLKLEFSKAKQGVDDSKDKKEPPKPVPAFVELAWKPPFGTVETIPARNLSPDWMPESFVSTSPFPPDDRSIGYERGSSVSRSWENATTDAAIEVAGYVIEHLRELAGVRDDAPDREAKLREFAVRFVERAFRHPLTDDQKTLYVDHQFQASGDPEAAVKRVILLSLKSPRFLYREIGGGGDDPYEVASRISFALWDSLPDKPLLDAAARGELTNRDQVAAQAERMVGDLRTRAKVREFFLQWLKVQGGPEIAKDPDRFPEFNAAIVADLRTSLDLFLDEVVWGDRSDFRELLRSDSIYLNGRLAAFYGAELMPDAPFQKMFLDPEERAGVLSHPYLMASFSYTGTTSPIHRGVFLSRSVLGRALKPPPEAVSPLAPDLHASLSTRERVALQTSPSACMTCHGMINPLGFGLERFDAVGRLRWEEKGRPIDATGLYESPSGGTENYTGARELGGLLAASEETHSAFVTQLFHHLVKQPIRAYGPDTQGSLRQSFADRHFHIRKLMVEIVATTALADRPQAPPAPELAASEK